MANDHLKKLAKQGFGFAVFPEVRIYKEPGKGTLQHLIFGDYITPPKSKNAKGYQEWNEQHIQEFKNQQWLLVRSRQQEGWIRLDEIQLERTLEVNFVDIGQGDGCHLVTPDDEHYIIDAGKGDNMYRFLRWRFNLSKAGPALPKFYAVISHPDEDHWKGFAWLLSKPPASQPRPLIFDTLFHNGIVQRSGSKLGKTIKHNGIHYLQDFIKTSTKLKNAIKHTGPKSNYEKFLEGALQHFPALKIKTLYRHVNAPAYLYKNKKLLMEVLAPVPEKVNDQWMLRWFDSSLSDIGKTKNGHSILLMAGIGKMKILLGGDLNSKSADYLMQQYASSDIRLLRIQIDKAQEPEKSALQEKMELLVTKCRQYLQAEITKSCHHGSHDITNEFLKAVNPIATVISSGDEESFAHPRPETLGAIGKYGRGARPLIYSTELARSSPEFIEIAKARSTDKQKQRVVATYGMITVRTDGEKAVIAQKLEKPRSSFGLITKWHIDKIIWNDERNEFITRE